MKGIFISVLIVGFFVSWLLVLIQIGLLNGLALMVGVITATCVLLIWNERDRLNK